jgi:hypothetical protein
MFVDDRTQPTPNAMPTLGTPFWLALSGVGADKSHIIVLPACGLWDGNLGRRDAKVFARRTLVQSPTLGAAPAKTTAWPDDRGWFGHPS